MLRTYMLSHLQSSRDQFGYSDLHTALAALLIEMSVFLGPIKEYLVDAWQERMD